MRLEDSDFGLGGSVFTRDVERGKRVARGIDTGMMFVNNISWLVRLGAMAAPL